MWSYVSISWAFLVFILAHLGIAKVILEINYKFPAECPNAIVVKGVAGVL